MAALAAGFVASFFLARLHETGKEHGGVASIPRPAEVAPVATPTRLEPTTENAAAMQPVPIQRPVEIPAESVRQFHPRDPGEWQGMLVNTVLQPVCETSAGCGMAAACVREKCGPCQYADDCAVGEICVLDHCVKRDNAACTGRSDCSRDELCILSGYSSDPRGNSDMRASCVSPHGGSPRPRPAANVEEAAAQARATDPLPQRLLNELRNLP
jgi:hypothetical protein